MRRWISWGRPRTRPPIPSRTWRVPVDRGSMAYSAVTQPPPEPRRNGGTSSWTEAAQSTRVRPQVSVQQPSAEDSR